MDYASIRRTFHTLRAGAASMWMGGTAAAFVAWGWREGLAASVLAAVVVGQALVRRRHPDRSPLGSLLLDSTVLVATFVLIEVPPAAAVPLFAFVLTAAFLLLEMRLALAVGAFALTATTAVFLLSSPGGLTGEMVLNLTLGLLGMGSMGFMFVVAARRLEEMRAAHRAALQAERKAGQMKNEFVSMVSHELRTPLTSIAGFAETLRETWKQAEPDEVEEFLEIIAEQAQHLSELVEDILVIPRLDTGRIRLEPTYFELRPVAYRIADLLFPSSEGKEATVAIPGGVMVWADAGRVKEVLRNLLENAKKYGGDQVLVEGAPVRDRYLVIVSDNGPGVPEEDRDRIFEHFEQGSTGDGRKESGIGLGLPIARKLARAMGGDLWFEPRFPTGSRFSFTIDLRAPEDRSLEPQGSSGTQSLSSA